MAELLSSYVHITLCDEVSQVYDGHSFMLKRR